MHEATPTGFVSWTRFAQNKFPKQFVYETHTATDGYPLHRRQKPDDGGFTINVGKFEGDNRWVVP